MDDTQNFEKTLLQLKSFVALPIENDRDRAGIIQAFEFTFEQCWKSIQKRAGSEGTQVASPKQAFMFAFQQGWISKTDENKWLRMIEDRNLTSHTYKQELAADVLGRVQNTYIPCFETLLKHLR